MTRMLSGEVADASRVNNLDRVGRFSPRAGFNPTDHPPFDATSTWDDSVVEGVWHLSGLWCFIWARVHVLVDDSIDTFFMGFELPWQPDPNLTALDTDTTSTEAAASGSMIGSGYLRDQAPAANSRVCVVGLYTPTGTTDDPHWSAGIYLDDRNNVYQGTGTPFVFDEADNRGTITAEYPVDPNELAGLR